MPDARMLILMPSWVGDAVMATPTLRAIRRAHPAAHLVALVRPGLDRLLAGLPVIDACIVHPMKGVAGALGAGRAARGAAPDTVVILPNSFRAALVAWLSRAPRRIGFRTDGRGWLLTDGVPPPDRMQPVPALDWYAELARAGVGVPVDDRSPFLAVTADEQARAAPVVEAAGTRFAVLNPGANRLDKRWPVERFAAVATHLAAQHGLKVVLSGAPAERPLLEEIVASCRIPVVNAAQFDLDLGSLKALLAQARVLVTNDTGPRHIAAALGTPTVCLFGPTDHRWTTLPVPNQRLVLAEPFLPAELVADRHAKACAIDRISVGDVCFAVDALLGRADEAASATPVAPRR